MSRKATRSVRGGAHVRIGIASRNVAPRVTHRRWRMFALVVGTLLSLLIPLLAFYFSSCAETQGPFEQTAATIVGNFGIGLQSSVARPLRPLTLP